MASQSPYHEQGRLQSLQPALIFRSRVLSAIRTWFEAAGFTRPLDLLRELIGVQVLRERELANGALIEGLQRTETRERKINSRQLV